MKRIVITGPKSSGKSHIGHRYAELVNLPFFDLDEVIEELYKEDHGKKLTFREIFRECGEAVFREYEEKAAKKISTMENIIVSTGGTTFTLSKLREILIPNSYVIFLKNDREVLWDRTIRKGLPSFLDGLENPKAAFFERIEKATIAIKPSANLTLNTSDLSIEDVAQLLDVELIRRGLRFGNRG